VAVVSGSRVGDWGPRVGALAGCGGVGRAQEAALVHYWIQLLCQVPQAFDKG